MTFNETLTKLRAHLHTNPSPASWNQICDFFDQLPADCELQTFLDYANTHLNTWPDHLRLAQPHWRPRLKRGGEPGRWSLVRTIVLNHKHLGSRELERLISPTLDHLTTLDLSHNLLDDVCAELIAEAPSFNNLTAVAIAHNIVGSKGFAALLSGDALPHLSHLSISHNRIDERGPQLITQQAQHPPLTHLQIGGNHLGDNGLKQLSSLPWFSQLVALDCADTGLYKNSAETISVSLERSRKIAFLNLSNNPLSDRLIDSLLNTSNPFSHLKVLLLRNCKLSSDGLETLFRHRPSWLTTLTHLDLSHNLIGDRSAQLLAKTDPLPALRELDLSANRISPETCEQLIASELASRVKLTLSQDLSWDGLLAQQ